MQDLGYSPFRPHMSFTSSSSSTTAATVPNNTNNTNNTATTAAPNAVANSGAANLGAGVGGARQNPFPSALAAAGGAGEEAEALAAEELAVEADVDDALAMLLSLGRPSMTSMTMLLCCEHVSLCLPLLCCCVCANCTCGSNRRGRPGDWQGGGVYRGEDAGQPVR